VPYSRLFYVVLAFFSLFAFVAILGMLGFVPFNPLGALEFGEWGTFGSASAISVENIKVQPDFQIELLYTVPRDRQGSWVCLCVDDKGRLLTSDQAGKLYRIVPPGLNCLAEDTKVEEIPVDLGEAQGLVWAFNSLYVVVNRSKRYSSGLWRVYSSRDDDVLDAKEKLRDLEGLGEHGPHAVLLGPDGQSLYVLCGNHTKMTALTGSKVPQVWGEDCLVKRLWDPNGHAVDIFAPGGCIYKTDRHGKYWELHSMGYRNQYDAAFNRDGELFTCDSDMEWDINLPWYRPTRLCHAVPGGDFGWRSGTANMYEYQPDNLPPVLNLGRGSPTGMTFGYGAKFPARYQEALFICDWSFGKISAVHLIPSGSTYSAEIEEFLSGLPLPLTDAVVNPHDGALYFTVGGRGALSSLYRVSYVGKNPTGPLKAAMADVHQEHRQVRKNLESYYGKREPQAVEAVWPNLSSPDRFERWAAQTALEFQDPDSWQEKALAEPSPVALTHALIGLARVGSRSLQPRILEALERVDWGKLTPAEKVDYLRAYQLALLRMGPPEGQWAERVSRRLDGFYVAESREVNAELCKLVCYLHIPGSVAKSLALLANAPTQEEQIEYALSLRIVRTGWTLAEREEYFRWFHKAALFKGGHSLHGFLHDIRAAAIDSLSNTERAALKPMLAVVPQPPTGKFAVKNRPFVRKWTVAELVPVLEQGLKGRDFDRGRGLFGDTGCFACHRFGNEGGDVGPDLTSVSARFGFRDLLESIVEPSKVVSDQYQASVLTLTDGKVVIGRIVDLHVDVLHVNTDALDPGLLVNVNRRQIESIVPSRVSVMPEGLIDGLTQEEILDLIAYLCSRGDRQHRMFRPD
jgi:putative heme-binding domain-containing protein